jgi:hypothetical protein
MKKSTNLIASALFACAMFFGSHAKAQTSTPATWRLGVGLETGIATGAEHKRGHYDIGGTARLQYGLSKNFALTLTSGYYDFIGIKNTRTGLDFPNLGIIPVKVGVKAFFAPNLYFGAEAGAGFVTNNGNTKLILSPALGYANTKWDFSARYENFSGQGINYGVAGLRIAYAFGL